MFVDNEIEAKNLIIERFPQFAGSVFEVNTYGWANFVVNIDDEYIFRFPRSKEAFDIIEIENDVLKDLKTSLPQNISVPDFAYYNFDSDGPFVGYRMINGEFISKEIYDNISDEQKEIFAVNIARFLSALHRFDYSTYDVEIVDPIKEFQEFYKKIQDVCFKYLNDAEKEWTNQLFSKYFSDSKMRSFTPSLIHGDLSDDHILVDGNNLGIIDFGDVRVFDPAYDFTWTFWFDEGLFDKIYKHYDGRKDDNFKYRIQEFYLKRTDFHGIIHGDEMNDQKLIEESLRKLMVNIS